METLISNASFQCYLSHAKRRFSNVETATLLLKSASIRSVTTGLPTAIMLGA